MKRFRILLWRIGMITIVTVTLFGIGLGCYRIIDSVDKVVFKNPSD